KFKINLHSFFLIDEAAYSPEPTILPNQVQTTISKDTAKPESGGAVQPTPLNGDNKDEKQQPDPGMVMRARKWIGVLVYKESDDGSKHTGEVVDYSEETELYKIEYENDVSEDLDYEALLPIVAPPPVVCQYLESIGPSENEKRKKKRHLSDTTVPIHPRRPAAPVEPEPKKRKAKKPAGSASTYVPLAYRETKKDAYYYYY
ncbi:hypothetical protein POUND7_012569, partial [Theobroma cacao]